MQKYKTMTGTKTNEQKMEKTRAKYNPETLG